MEERPELFHLRGRSVVVPVIPRNTAPLALLLRGNYILVPQNAWPYARPTGTWRELLRWSLLRVMTELAVYRAKGVLRISSAIPERVSRSRHSSVVHNVLDADFERVLQDSRAKPAGCMADYILCVGQLTSYKNLERLLAGYGVYSRGGGALRLMIRGERWDERYAVRIERLAAEMPRVTLEGRPATREEVVGLLRCSAGVIFAALVEASPITLLEALALECPIAVSAITGHLEILDAAGAGDELVTFSPSSVESISRAFWALEQAQRPRSCITSVQGRSAARQRWTAEMLRFLEDLT